MPQMAIAELARTTVDASLSQPIDQQKLGVPDQLIYPQPQSLLQLIAEITEMRRRGEPITSLAGGLPPNKRLKHLWTDVYPHALAELALEIQAGEALQYTSPEGHPLFRQWAARDVSILTGKEITPEQIITTAGLQYGISATIQALCLPEKKVVLTQTPTYSAFLEAAKVPADIEVVAVASDEQGMIPEALEETIIRLRQNGVEPGLAYGMVIGNPTGEVMSDKRGATINEICKISGLPFFVDYAYYRLNFPAVSAPQIGWMDDNVILGFTTSKLGAPGGRLGYLVITNPDLYDKIKKVKSAQMMSLPTPMELLFFKLATQPAFELEVKQLMQVYQQGVKAGLKAVRDNADILACQEPGGGMFLWVAAPPTLSTSKHLGRILHEERIGYSPGIWFQPDQLRLPDGSIIGPKADDNHMRLCAVTESPEVVYEAINRLAGAFRAFV